MMVMASPLPVFFAGRFIGTILTPFYFATPENDWHTLIQPHIARLVGAARPKRHVALLRGLGAGRSIRVAGWLPMFLRWATFGLGLVLGDDCR